MTLLIAVTSSCDPKVAAACLEVTTCGGEIRGGARFKQTPRHMVHAFGLELPQPQTFVSESLRGHAFGPTRSQPHAAVIFVC